MYTTGRVRGRVHGPCIRLCKCSCVLAVYTAAYTARRVHGMYTGHVHVPRRHATAVCGPSRPCTRPVHNPFTTVYTAVYSGRGGTLRPWAVYTAVT